MGLLQGPAERGGCSWASSHFLFLPLPTRPLPPGVAGAGKAGRECLSPPPPLLRHSPQAPAPLCPRTNVLGVVGSLGLDAEGWDPVPPAHHWLPASCLLLHPGQLSPELQSVSAREGQTWADDLLGQVRAPRSGERGAVSTGRLWPGCGALWTQACAVPPSSQEAAFRWITSQVVPACWEGPSFQGRESKGSSPPACAPVLSRTQPAGPGRLGGMESRAPTHPDLAPSPLSTISSAAVPTSD